MLGAIALAQVLIAPDGSMEVLKKTAREISFLRPTGSGYAAVSLDVDPEGHVLACRIDDQAGQKRINSQMCDIAMKLRLSTVASIDGVPAHGRWRTTISYFDKPVRESPFKLSPELTVSVSRLPEGVANPLDVKLAVQVSSAGYVKSCSGAASASAAYATAACGQLAGAPIRPPMTDREGHPVAFVASLTARFIVDTPASKERPK